MVEYHKEFIKELKMNYKTQDEKFDSFVINIKTYFNNEKNKLLFNQRNIIKKVEFDGVEYVVKSFKIPHLLNKVVYRFFRDSKAKRSYENSVRLMDLGVNTPKPIGYVEFPSIIFFKESFYVSEFFDYDFEIRAVFTDAKFEDREDILQKFVEFSYDLHNKGVYHIDYSPGNILVKRDANGYSFSIIDVNRMKFKEFDIDLRMQALSRLTKSKEDNDYMISHYAEIASMDKNLLAQRFAIHLKAEEKYLANKKRLKSMKRKA